MIVRRLFVIVCALVLTLTGCAFHGLNSLPLPGTLGRGAGASIYHVEVDNVGTLEPNSPVMVGDVVVGSVRAMKVRGWHADVEISVEPHVVVPTNVVAAVGQTSLLGSMHLELNPPYGQHPVGQLTSGATIPLDRTSSYPSTEQTLASLSALVNGGGLGQIGEVIHNAGLALGGRQNDVRELLSRLDRFVGTLDAQRDDIVASIQALDRLSGTFAAQHDVISRVLRKLPPALDVLTRERPRLTTALGKLGTFSDTATGLINDTKADLVTNLKNLDPAIGALADVGPEFGKALAFAAVFPYGQTLIDRAFHGDYANLFAVLDLTVPRLKRGLMAGTTWAQENASLSPAPGDPWYLNFTFDPTPPPPPGAPPGEGAAPMPASPDGGGR